VLDAGAVLSGHFVELFTQLREAALHVLYGHSRGKRHKRIILVNVDSVFHQKLNFKVVAMLC